MFITWSIRCFVIQFCMGINDLIFSNATSRCTFVFVSEMSLTTIGRFENVLIQSLIKNTLVYVSDNKCCIVIVIPAKD